MLRLILLIMLTFASSAQAQTKLGLMGSLLYNVPETDFRNNDGVDEESQMGFGAGMRAIVPLSSGLMFRTGAGFVQKKVGYEVNASTSTGTADLSFLYLNVPATLYLTGLDERLGIFAGTALNARLSDDCESSGALDACRDVNPKTLVLPATLGFDFTISPQFSMELSYEYGFMDTAKDLKISSAVLSFIYNFSQ